LLRFGDEEARALITGAAYSYNKYVQGSQVTVPLAAFSDAHSAPAQRFYNLLCTAYGSDQARYGDFVEKEYLPKSRARSCMREFNTTAFAFRELAARRQGAGNASQIAGVLCRKIDGPPQTSRPCDACKEEICDSAEQAARHCHIWSTQYGYIRREAFEGVGGAPSTDNNVFYTSLRYYPF
jgi:putative metallopeptidase DUF4344